jgi:hypothetical protein
MQYQHMQQQQQQGVGATAAPAAPPPTVIPTVIPPIGSASAAAAATAPAPPSTHAREALAELRQAHTKRVSAQGPLLTQLQLLSYLSPPTHQGVLAGALVPAAVAQKGPAQQQQAVAAMANALSHPYLLFAGHPAVAAAAAGSSSAGGAASGQGGVGVGVTPLGSGTSFDLALYNIVKQDTIMRGSKFALLAATAMSAARSSAAEQARAEMALWTAADSLIRLTRSVSGPAAASASPAVSAAAQKTQGLITELSATGARMAAKYQAYTKATGGDWRDAGVCGPSGAGVAFRARMAANRKRVLLFPGDPMDTDPNTGALTQPTLAKAIAAASVTQGSAATAAVTAAAAACTLGSEWLDLVGARLPHPRDLVDAEAVTASALATTDEPAMKQENAQTDTAPHAPTAASLLQRVPLAKPLLTPVYSHATPVPANAPPGSANLVGSRSAVALLRDLVTMQSMNVLAGVIAVARYRKHSELRGLLKLRAALILQQQLQQQQQRLQRTAGSGGAGAAAATEGDAPFSALNPPALYPCKDAAALQQLQALLQESGMVGADGAPAVAREIFGLPPPPDVAESNDPAVHEIWQEARAQWTAWMLAVGRHGRTWVWTERARLQRMAAPSAPDGSGAAAPEPRLSFEDLIKAVTPRAFLSRPDIGRIAVDQVLQPGQMQSLYNEVSGSTLSVPASKEAAAFAQGLGDAYDAAIRNTCHIWLRQTIGTATTGFLNRLCDGRAALDNEAITPLLFLRLHGPRTRPTHVLAAAIAADGSANPLADGQAVEGLETGSAASNPFSGAVAQPDGLVICNLPAAIQEKLEETVAISAGGNLVGPTTLTALDAQIQRLRSERVSVTVADVVEYLRMQVEGRGLGCWSDGENLDALLPEDGADEGAAVDADKTGGTDWSAPGLSAAPMNDSSASGVGVHPIGGTAAGGRRGRGGAATGTDEGKDARGDPKGDRKEDSGAEGGAARAAGRKRGRPSNVTATAASTRSRRGAAEEEADEAGRPSHGPPLVFADSPEDTAVAAQAFQEHGDNAALVLVGSEAPSDAAPSARHVPLYRMFLRDTDAEVASQGNGRLGKALSLEEMWTRFVRIRRTMQLLPRHPRVLAILHWTLERSAVLDYLQIERSGMAFDMANATVATAPVQAPVQPMHQQQQYRGMVPSGTVGASSLPAQAYAQQQQQQQQQPLKIPFQQQPGQPQQRQMGVAMGAVFRPPHMQPGPR